MHSVSTTNTWTIEVKKTKFEIELIKIVDCFLDGQGKYTSNLVSLKKSL